SVFITTNPDTGQAPLTVSFFVVPSNGVAPFSYSWDFDNDGTPDSNAPSGQFTYTESATASVTVTDNAGQSISAQKTITITPGTGGGGGTQDLSVKFNVSPRVGSVPFDATFTPVVTGGKKPYNYAWDFEGDGVYDSFIDNPVYTYEQIGQEVSDSEYV